MFLHIIACKSNITLIFFISSNENQSYQTNLSSFSTTGALVQLYLTKNKYTSLSITGVFFKYHAVKV
ncbi:hypothetical protein HOG27_05165 [bacterium]|nr:hypothetical protein [bacterium]